MTDRAELEITGLTFEQERVIEGAIDGVETAWWNCNGGESAHQSYIELLIDLHALLGRGYKQGPSGQPVVDTRIEREE